MEMKWDMLSNISVKSIGYDGEYIYTSPRIYSFKLEDGSIGIILKEDDGFEQIDVFIPYSK